MVESALLLLLGSPGQGVTQIPEPPPVLQGWVPSITLTLSTRGCCWGSRALAGKLERVRNGGGLHRFPA